MWRHGRGGCIAGPVHRKRHRDLQEGAGGGGGSGWGIGGPGWHGLSPFPRTLSASRSTNPAIRIVAHANKAYPPPSQHSSTTTTTIITPRMTYSRLLPTAWGPLLHRHRTTSVHNFTEGHCRCLSTTKTEATQCVRLTTVGRRNVGRHMVGSSWGVQCCDRDWLQLLCTTKRTDPPYAATRRGCRSPGRRSSTSADPVSSTKNSFAPVSPCGVGRGVRHVVDGWMRLGPFHGWLLTG